MSVSGLGPHGERAVPPERVALSEHDVASARKAKFRVAIVLHITDSDWARQLLAGMTRTFDECETVVLETVDCGLTPEGQIEALDRVRERKPNAVISVPVANAKVADAHRRVTRAGIRLLLHDNVPTGLLPGSDYVALVSADNFGLGTIAASLLAEHVPADSAVAILSYHCEFFATIEREIAFDKWMRANRPDLRLHVRKFESVESAGDDALALMAAVPDLAGLFVVWDTPAMQAVKALERVGRHVPVTTIDLGSDAAIDLASDGMVCGVGAQQPYLQGVAVARACVLSMLGKQTPEWIALPGIPVGRANVEESFRNLFGSQLERKTRPER